MFLVAGSLMMAIMPLTMILGVAALIILNTREGEREIEGEKNFPVMLTGLQPSLP